MGGFEATALVLGVVGLYGVTSYSVVQRTTEIGGGNAVTGSCEEIGQGIKASTVRIAL